jgi:low affinity Fe/Cu permease
MKKRNKSGINELFEKFAAKMTMLTGRPQAFLIAFGIILIWGITGPIFKFSDTWQLVINTGTTIVTFLMVFLIQQSQNKDSLSIQLKLNEIVAALEGASNRLINVEDISQEELVVLHKYYHKLALMAAKEESINKSHSVEEATIKHEIKQRSQKAPMVNKKAV